MSGKRSPCRETLSRKKARLRTGLPGSIVLSDSDSDEGWPVHEDVPVQDIPVVEDIPIANIVNFEPEDAIAGVQRDHLNRGWPVHEDVPIQDIPSVEDIPVANIVNFEPEDAIAGVQIDHPNSSDNGSSESGESDGAPDVEENIVRSDQDQQSSGSSSSGSSDSDSNNGESEDSASIESDSDSEVTDNDEEPIIDDHPLYAGAPLTLSQSIMAIMTFALAHSLTGNCIKDLIKLISLHCPPNNRCIESLFKLKSFFRIIGAYSIVFHHFCVGCMVILPNKTAVCHSCPHPTEKSYFIEVPLLGQLQALFKSENFYQKLQYRFNRQKINEANVEDIYDGNLYKSQFENDGFLSSPNNISFMLYSDGISVFKSSKFSIWPVYLVINELKYKERYRRQHFILAGIWFGTKKPNVHVFLEPLGKSLRAFKEDGFLLSVHGQNDKIRVRGFVLCATFDLQAKSTFMNFKMGNGFYGCTRCKLPGLRYPLQGASVHCYPYHDNLDVRSHEEVTQHAENAFQLNEPVYGVKGMSRLYLMMPDFIRGMAQDIMHGCYLGLTKMLMNFWFDSKFSDQPFSLSGMIDLIDERLMLIKPPSYVKRIPRSIKEFKAFWKALEYKVFLHYYSIPILVDFLPVNYFNHHLKLVSALFLLGQQSISQQQLETASQLLKNYVADFQELYGLRYLGINVHQLLHLVDVVRDLGPTWVYACFVFEDFNGHLCKIIHGTRHSAMQVAHGSFLLISLPIYLNRLPDNCHVKQFCNKLNIKGAQFKRTETFNEKYFVIGNFSNNVPLDVQMSVRAFLGVNDGCMQKFYRCQKGNILFCSSDYVRHKLNLSTFVSCVRDNQSLLFEINHLIKWMPCNCGNVCDCEGKKFVCVGTLYERVMWEATNRPDVRLGYLAKVRKTEFVHVFYVTQVRSLCYFMNINGNMYIAEPVNSLETE